jgi:GrpB-like predicted nucleotidyltransferase (UPF0157 family)
VPYRPEWAQLFHDEKARIVAEIGDLVLDVQHVGSTAIPNLAAKPIIDIAIAVSDESVIPEITKRLENIGYMYRGDGGQHGGHLLVKEREPDVRTHHVHIVARDDEQWQNYLGFRDILRGDERLRTQYVTVKHELKQHYSDNREAYTSGKHEFIAGVLQRLNKDGI